MRRGAEHRGSRTAHRAKKRSARGRSRAPVRSAGAGPLRGCEASVGAARRAQAGQRPRSPARGPPPAACPALGARTRGCRRPSGADRGAGFWKTIATSRSRGGRPSDLRPPIQRLPAEGDSSPAISRNSVLFPEPDGPTIASSSPWPITRSTAETASMPPGNTFPIPRSSTCAKENPRCGKNLTDPVADHRRGPRSAAYQARQIIFERSKRIFGFSARRERACTGCKESAPAPNDGRFFPAVRGSAFWAARQRMEDSDSPCADVRIFEPSKKTPSCLGSYDSAFGWARVSRPRPSSRPEDSSVPPRRHSACWPYLPASHRPWQRRQNLRIFEGFPGFRELGRGR